jgi:exodeoxyribonuclease-5
MLQLIQMAVKYTLSPDQAAALQHIGQWYRSKSAPYLTLGGYAGTGKTTLIAVLREKLRELDDDLAVAFCAFTGKAARVLDTKLREQKVPRFGDNVSTIHSLIYVADLDGAGSVTNWRKKDKDEVEYDLIIVDEASMVDETIWNDLLSYEIPVLAVGDHGQLPPVSGRFNLMQNPQIKLERIFRQAEDSPIVEVATIARTTGEVPPGDYGDGVRKLDRTNEETGQIVQELIEGWRPDRLVLCGYNHTRVKLNQAIRQQRDFEGAEPTVGDRVVCLKNNRRAKIYNGMTGTIRHLYRPDTDRDKDQKWYEVEIELDNEDYKYYGYILREQFGARETIKDTPLAPDKKPGDLFDFGYALTVHKAQGSESEEVLLFEERFPKMTDDDWRRWLYTGITRASVRLTIVG